MPTSFTEDNRLDDVLLWEGDARYSRDVVTLSFAGAATWKVGTVLGKITANGKFRISNDGGSDGTEVAVAVLAETVTASGAGDVKAVAIRRLAICKKLGLQWDASYDTQNKKDAAMVELEAVGILSRVSA